VGYFGALREKPLQIKGKFELTYLLRTNKKENSMKESEKDFLSWNSKSIKILKKMKKEGTEMIGTDYLIHTKK